MARRILTSNHGRDTEISKIGKVYILSNLYKVEELHLRAEGIQGTGSDIARLGHSPGTGLKQYKLKFPIISAPLSGILSTKRLLY